MLGQLGEVVEVVAHCRRSKDVEFENNATVPAPPSNQTLVVKAYSLDSSRLEAATVCDEMILVLFGSKCLTIQLAHRITGTSYRIGYVIQTSLKSHVFLVREKCELNPCREHRVRFQPVQRSWSPIVISFIIHASRTKSLDSVCLWH